MTAHVETCPRCGTSVNGKVDATLSAYTRHSKATIAVFACPCGYTWHAAAEHDFKSAEARYERIHEAISYHKTRATSNRVNAIIFGLVALLTSAYCWICDFSYYDITLDNSGTDNYDHLWFPMLIVAIVAFSLSISKYAMYIEHRTAQRILKNMLPASDPQKPVA